VEDGQKAVDAVKELAPDVVVMDIAMPRMNGIEAADMIKASKNPPAILMLSAYQYNHYVLACIRAEVNGYLLKNTPPDELKNAIRMVYRGEGVYNFQAAARLLSKLASSKNKEFLNTFELNQRELQVLKLAAKGKSNKEISNELDISEHTVRTHLANIFKKIQVSSRGEAAAYAYKEGLMELIE
jgi:DNA-binding NarL/FixJ family response regulator